MYGRGWPPFGLNLGVTATTVISPGDDNEILTETTYVNATAAPDQWVVDAFITSSEELPQGTEIRITNPNIGGTTYTLPSAKTELWLSDLLFFQQATAPRRTKLNGHTSQTFDFTVVLPESTGEITTTLTFNVVTSSQVPAGSRQSNGNPMVSPLVLGVSSATITLKEEVVV